MASEDTLSLAIRNQGIANIDFESLNAKKYLTAVLTAGNANN